MLLAMATAVWPAARPAAAKELAVEDFQFDGPLGSDGATIERLGENHFKISLGHAPQQPTWCNMLYFQIDRRLLRRHEACTTMTGRRCCR